MNNALRTLFAFSTIGLSTVCASELEPMHITVPFAFMAGKTALPAGDYTVVEESSRVILIKGARGSAILLGAATKDTASETSGMTFRHTDSGYSLKEVHSWGRPSSLLPVVNTPAK